MTTQDRPTIHDVAALAKVSIATVSNVVNQRANVRDGTKQRVLDAINTLGYKASRAAKSLPAGRTFMLAYCLPSDAAPNSALDVFLNQIVSTASDADLEVLLVAQKGADRVGPYVELVRRGGADGFLLSGIEYDDTRISFLSERNVPFVCFGRAEDPSVHWVDVDGAAGIRSAVTHVHEQGHERLAFVGWPEGSATGDHRLSGFMEQSKHLGLPAGAIVRADNDFDSGRKLVRELLDQSDPTAIVCVSDTLALGVMAGLRDVELMPGRDVAVTGFDDVPAASLCAPGLTSLRQPMDKVGALLVERLVALLTGEDVPESVLVEPDLIVRKSTNSSQAELTTRELPNLEGNL